MNSVQIISAKDAKTLNDRLPKAGPREAKLIQKELARRDRDGDKPLIGGFSFVQESK